jgi:hypothetical protein
MTRPLAACALAFAAALAAALLLPSAANGRQEYGKKEGKDCRHCHLSDRGGGPRNEAGRLYEANGLTFDKSAWSGDAAKDAYRRAYAAVRAGHQREARRLLAELKKSETLPGGVALVQALEEKVKPFPPAWLRAAKKGLAGTEAQRKAGLAYLLRLVGECEGAPEQVEGAAILADLRRDAKVAADLEAAEKDHARRRRYVDARLLEELGDAAGAKKAFEALVADAPATEEGKLAKERLDLAAAEAKERAGK